MFANKTIPKPGILKSNNYIGIITISGTTCELKEFKRYLSATIVSISGCYLCKGTLSC
jgi:hypothetical protein